MGVPYFRGTVSGTTFSKAIRVGSKESGLVTRAMSPQGIIETRVWYDYTIDRDRFEIYQLPWKGVGVKEPLVAGVIGTPTAPSYPALVDSEPLSEQEEDAKWKEEQENGLLFEDTLKKDAESHTPFGELQNLSEKMAQLTEIETQILELVMKGHTTSSVARTMCRSPKTISYHRQRLLDKLEAVNAADLVRIGTIFKERSRFEGC